MIKVKHVKRFEMIENNHLYQELKRYIVQNSCFPSQRQEVIKLIEKKVRDKRPPNWRPLSLLNVDEKLMPKALVESLKNVLSDIVSANQAAYLQKSSQVKVQINLYGLLKLCDTFIKEDYLRVFGFVKIFIEQIETLLNNQESCNINGGKTSNYFKLERGARQGVPISA